MQQMVLALLLLPAVFYFGLLARVLHRALLTDKPRGVDFEEFWGPRSSPGERAHLQLGRQESLNALWSLVNHGGEPGRNHHFPLELVTEDVQYEDPLLRIEGWQEIEQLTSVFRRFSEYALLQIDSVQHNQEKALVEARLEVQPRFLPIFELPVRLHIFFEEEVKVYKVKSEWRGVPLISEKTSPRLGKAHSWLRRGTGRVVAALIDAGYL